MGINELKLGARKLSLRQLRALDEWLHQLIRKAEEGAEAKTSPLGRQERTAPEVTYRLERVRCGKEKCKCARGRLHGPYWYSYTRVGGKIKSQYLGKKPPPGAEEAGRGRGRS